MARVLITQMSFGDRKVLEPILGVGFPDLRFLFCTTGLGVSPHPATAEPGTPPSTAAIAGPMVGCPLECRGPEPQEKGGLSAPPSPPDPVPSSGTRHSAGRLRLEEPGLVRGLYPESKFLYLEN